MEPLASSTEAILTTAIEVGVGIVGFTGIVIALIGRKRTGLYRILVSALLISSIATIAFSYLPLFLIEISVKPPMLWMVCSGILVLYIPTVAVVRYLQFGSLENIDKEWEGEMYIWITRLLTIVMIALALLQLVNVFYLQAQWPYILVVVSYVLLSLSIFAILILGILRTDTDA